MTDVLGPGVWPGVLSNRSRKEVAAVHHVAS